MPGELLLRFVVGGLVVSAFAVVGHVIRPKTLAGLFGAAPSVALATLGLTYHSHPPAYAAVEGRSMIAGAVALLCYSAVVSWALLGRGWNTLASTVLSWGVWLAVALGLWAVLLRG